MRAYEEETIAAIATPPGKGGIAAIRLSGCEARRIAAVVFKAKNTEKTVENMPGYTAAFGDFIARGKRMDEGVALVYSAPHSYTGEEVVELFCHGGNVVCEAVLDACLEAGAAVAARGEFTKRAFLNGKLRLNEAEAVMELIDASSRGAAGAARALLTGRLTQEIADIKTLLLEEAAHMAAWLDYPEEDVPEVESKVLLERVRRQLERIRKLVAGYERGALLKRGLRVAIVGSPNVGKSTLFNLLSGYERAIVTAVAGTTRDVLREEIRVGGIPLHVLDTAGLHDGAEDLVEQEGIKRSKDEMDNADLLIYVLDGSQALPEADPQMQRISREKPCLCVVNKRDLGLRADVEEIKGEFRQVLVLSAFEADALEKLEKAILSLLRLENLEEDALLLCSKRQREAAKEAELALATCCEAVEGGETYDVALVCLQDAIEALAALSGENVSDSVIEAVFEQFCVGK